MDKLGDIDLFVRVVKNSGLAAAARETGLSPASVTVKINRLEDHYGVKLLKRTTRQITLTEEGKLFYDRSLRILSELNEVEELLKTGRDSLSGPLNVTAPVDLGRQYIGPLLAQFSKDHPKISAKLHLSDGVVNLIEGSFDLGIRYGVLEDNRMIARRLGANTRILCASPEYIKMNGVPKKPEDLKNHRCLTMIRQNEPLTEWLFNFDGIRKSIQVNPVLSSNNGEQVRRWAIDGDGVALKSYLDIQSDLKSQKLLPLLEDYTKDFAVQGIDGGSDLHVVYPNREFLPERIRKFIDVLMMYFNNQ